MRTRPNDYITMPLPFLDRRTVAELSRIDNQQRKQLMIYLVNSFTMPSAEQSKKRFQTEAECLAHLDSLCVTSGRPVPADIDDFGILVSKHL